MFRTGKKPTEPINPEPAKLQNPQEPVEPIEPVSRRQPVQQRVNKPIEPVVPVEPTPEPPEPEVLTVDEMLNMEDEELKSYGIDDPKVWKSYQRLLHKKEVEWRKKEGQYEDAISKLQQKTNVPVVRRDQPDPNQLNPNQQDLNVPLVKPQKPQRPASYDYTEALTDPNSISAQYMHDIETYREQNDAYQDQRIAQLTGFVSNEQQVKLQQQRREQVKSHSLARFRERGLTAKDATKLYDSVEEAYMADPETGADIFVNLFKGGKNPDGSELSPSRKRVPAKRKLPDDLILPPGVGSSTVTPVPTQSSSFMKAIAGKNQTRRIILNREKKR